MGYITISGEGLGGMASKNTSSFPLSSEFPNQREAQPSRVKNVGCHHCQADSDHLDYTPRARSKALFCGFIFERFLKILRGTGCGVHICNPSTWDAETGGQESEARLGYIARPCLRNQKTGLGVMMHACNPYLEGRDHSPGKRETLSKQ
jgi:hypothetical protein